MNEKKSLLRDDWLYPLDHECSPKYPRVKAQFWDCTKGRLWSLEELRRSLAHWACGLEEDWGPTLPGSHSILLAGHELKSFAPSMLLP